MNLAEYDHEIGYHLKMIREYADQCLFHVDHMTARPDFETQAMDDLQRVKRALLSATFTVMKAQARYQGKPIDAGTDP